MKTSNEELLKSAVTLKIDLSALRTESELQAQKIASLKESSDSTMRNIRFVEKERDELKELVENINEKLENQSAVLKLKIEDLEDAKKVNAELESKLIKTEDQYKDLRKENKVLSSKVESLQKSDEKQSTEAVSVSELFDSFIKKSEILLRQQSAENISSDSDVLKEKPLGRGSFKKAYKATWKGKKVAFVEFDGNFGNPDDLDESALKVIHREIEVIQRLSNHSNIVQLLSVTRQNNLIMELCSGDLVAHMKVNWLNLQNRIDLVFDFLRGIKFIHSLGYAHRDLKPQNILISIDGKAKITDFGSVKNIYTTTFRSSRGGSGGSHGFEGPEHKKKGIDARMGDIYAVGGVLIYFFTGMFPFEKQYVEYEDENRAHTKNLVLAWDEKKDYFPEIQLAALQKYFALEKVPAAGEKIAELIRRCMKTIPSARPSIVEIILTLKDIQKSCFPSQHAEFKEKDLSDESEQSKLTLLLWKMLEDFMEKKFGPGIVGEKLQNIMDAVEKGNELQTAGLFSS
jgi:hypothetical protein